jgi:hypothetical protein
MCSIVCLQNLIFEGVIYFKSFISETDGLFLSCLIVQMSVPWWRFWRASVLYNFSLAGFWIKFSLSVVLFKISSIFRNFVIFSLCLSLFDMYYYSLGMWKWLFLSVLYFLFCFIKLKLFSLLELFQT